jgi:hypothetical protein
VDVAELTRRQQVGLWLDGHSGLDTAADALQFMGEVAVALRYGAATNLPLASMYRATQRQVPVLENDKPAHARAFELTNALLSSGSVVEINVIANRLVLAHERVMPAIYALRREHDKTRLSDAARRALEFITDNATASSGDVRRLLNAGGQRRPDAADLALAELQRELLVDRGPSSGPSQGVFYLTREGYPYRLFAPSHAGIVSTASRLSRAEASAAMVSAYLEPAVFAARRKLLTLFQPLVSGDDIDLAIAKLTKCGAVEPLRIGSAEIVVYRAKQ